MDKFETPITGINVPVLQGDSILNSDDLPTLSPVDPDVLGNISSSLINNEADQDQKEKRRGLRGAYDRLRARVRVPDGDSIGMLLRSHFQIRLRKNRRVENIFKQRVEEFDLNQNKLFESGDIIVKQPLQKYTRFNTHRVVDHFTLLPKSQTSHIRDLRNACGGDLDSCESFIKERYKDRQIIKLEKEGVNPQEKAQIDILVL